jgi:hypothetical protein
MARLRRELADPWGILLAGVVGGVAGVLPGAGLLIGAGVAAAVYGVKVGAGALLGGPDRSAPGLAAPARPADGTPAAFWLARAERAVRQLDDMARGTVVSPTDVATGHAAEEADGVLDAMRRLGAQVVNVDQALARVVGADLEGEVARLRAVADRSPDDVSAQQSADAVADRLAVRDRLRKAQAALDGRLQSSALGLESLVARVAEVRAASAAAGEVDPSTDDLAALTAEVEGLRVGLADVEQVARRALGPGSAQAG